MSLKTKIGAVDRWLVFGAECAALATVFGFAGRLFWLLDLFSHFRVQIFQFCLVLIGIAIWRRNNKLLVICTLLACLNYAFVLPLYLGRPEPSSEKTVRTMLMNLNASNGSTNLVFNAIRAANPDVLLLEEVTPEWAADLSALDVSFPYRVARPRNDCFGIMLLSKLPLSNEEIVAIGRAGVPSILATVHLPAGEISLIGTHPVPPIGGEYSRDRNRQLAALPAVVQHQDHPVLLIGDLNTSPWSVYFSRLLTDSGLQNSMKGFGFQPSWPAGNRLLQIPLDHVLHSPDMVIHNRRVGNDVGSDHYPVIVDFSLQ